MKNLVKVLIWNTICKTKRPRQTVQTQIRSSLVRVFPVCYSDKPFVNLSPENILRTGREKCSNI